MISFRVACCALSLQLVTPGCTVEFGSGKAICGNGVAEDDETCDGEDLRGETCETLGLGGGTLACRADCTGYDASGCSVEPECGNNIKEAGEMCDETDLGGETCESMGLGGGTLACRADCTGYDASRCTNSPECGNNIKEAGEVCDGTDLLGTTCESLGLGGGTLACLSDCSGFDTSGCGLGSCQDGWVYIPAGDFEMGCNEDDPCSADYSNESPRHTVTLTAYCMQVTEVSVAEYRECKDAGGCPTGTPIETDEDIWCNWTSDHKNREDHPINCINWFESREYCQWLGGNLPTEAQWEKAARGVDGRTFTWGDTPGPSCDRCNWSYCYSSDPPGTWPVGYLTTTAGDSPYGLKDMAGNVWQWVLDYYNPSFYETCQFGCENPENKTNGMSGNRVMRGGSFLNNSSTSLRVVTRGYYDPSTRYTGSGFRCAMAPEIR